jgi:hypothetical protein
MKHLGAYVCFFGFMMGAAWADGPIALDQKPTLEAIDTNQAVITALYENNYNRFAVIQSTKPAIYEINALGKLRLLHDLTNEANFRGSYTMQKTLGNQPLMGVAFCSAQNRHENSRFFLTDAQGQYIYEVVPADRLIHTHPIKTFDGENLNKPATQQKHGLAVDCGQKTLYISQNRQSGHVLGLAFNPEAKAWQIMDQIEVTNADHDQDEAIQDLAFKNNRLYVWQKQLRGVTVIEPTSHQAIAAYDYSPIDHKMQTSTQAHESSMTIDKNDNLVILLKPSFAQRNDSIAVHIPLPKS